MRYGRLIKNIDRGAFTVGKVYVLQPRINWENRFTVTADDGNVWVVTKSSFWPVGEEFIKEEFLKIKEEL